MRKDYYSILGVSKTASQEEIKKAFRQKALQYHPDKNQGNKDSESKFKEINEAYGVLSDEKQKRNYDNPHHPMFGRTSMGGSNPMEDVLGTIFGSKGFASNFSRVNININGNEYQFNGGNNFRQRIEKNLKFSIKPTTRTAYNGGKVRFNYRRSVFETNKDGSAKSRPQDEVLMVEIPEKIKLDSILKLPKMGNIVDGDAGDLLLSVNFGIDDKEIKPEEMLEDQYLGDNKGNIFANFKVPLLSVLREVTIEHKIFGSEKNIVKIQLTTKLLRESDGTNANAHGVVFKGMGWNENSDFVARIFLDYSDNMFNNINNEDKNKIIEILEKK